jgi:hypothetical protein
MSTKRKELVMDTIFIAPLEQLGHGIPAIMGTGVGSCGCLAGRRGVRPLLRGTHTNPPQIRRRLRGLPALCLPGGHACVPAERDEPRVG